MVFGICVKLLRSFTPPGRNVFSIPPRFSGLGVRAVDLELIAGALVVAPGIGDSRAGLVGGGEVMVLPTSLLELFLEIYDGLFGSVLVELDCAGLAIEL